jgi:hypothetical protein
VRGQARCAVRLAGNVRRSAHQFPEHEWDTDEIDIAQAVADRLSLALRRPPCRATRNAEMERLTADMPAKWLIHAHRLIAQPPNSAARDRRPVHQSDALECSRMMIGVNRTRTMERLVS